MRLELPAVADGDRKVMPVAVARRVDQRARVMLGAAAVPVNHMEHAVRRPCHRILKRHRGKLFGPVGLIIPSSVISRETSAPARLSNATPCRRCSAAGAIDRSP